MGKRKLVILGGGMAGLATAWHLTNDKTWQDRFESITLHQMGWRLGGKCATGRGPNGRIEEHAIHLFGGGYYNALAMMRDVYRERYRSAGDDSFRHAFQNQYTSVRVLPNGLKMALNFPPRVCPLDDIPVAMHIRDSLAEVMAALCWTTVRLLQAPMPVPVPVQVQFKDAAAQTVDMQTATSVGLLADALGCARELAGAIRGKQDPLPALVRLQSLVGAHLPNPTVVSSHPLAAVLVSRCLAVLNLAAALSAGWQADIVQGRRSLADLDAQDHAAWLVAHGASPGALQSDVVRSTIGILYQHVAGNHTQPALGAGGFLHWLLRTFSYVQSPFWFFRHGTGDTLVTPLYQVLCKRGVHFEFFHKVENLGLSDDGGRIDTIRMRVQATVKGGAGYDPLVCGHWPAAPGYLQLDNGAEIEALARQEHDPLESYWSGYRAGQNTTLVAGKDFDDVVFAISIGAAPFVCPELDRHADWQAMVQHIRTVETESLQLWLKRDSAALGIHKGLLPGHAIPPDDTGLGACFATPYDAFSDFSDLIPFEDWPAEQQPQALWYFSDSVPTAHTTAPLADPAYPAARLVAAKIQAQTFLDQQLQRLLPDTRTAGGGFDAALLCAPAQSPAPLEHQHIRANIQPSERYVQAMPDTTRFRLDAGQVAGIRNLYIAGDWTYNGLNVGCVEAAVMSGRLAANSLLGTANSAEGVVGYFARQGPLD
jgi:uncharacterized protein with NAD-binding domain and iron-sulfur cluster